MTLESRASAIEGIGLFTTEAIIKHAPVGRVNVIREITEAAPLDGDKGEFFYHFHWRADGRQLLLGAPHRHTNHSCQPNIYITTLNTVSLHDSSPSKEVE